MISKTAVAAPQDYSIYIKRIIKSNIIDKSAAKNDSEISNQEHVQQLISPLDKSLVSNLVVLDFNFDAYWGGVVDSDLGKMDKYRQLLFKKSKDSDFLLTNLKGIGNQKIAQAISKYLEDNGFKNKQILNPELSNDQIRSVFRAHPILTYYLHALPGIIESFKSLLKDQISVKTFQIRLGANLFHNGPTSPQQRPGDKNIFWHRFTKKFLPNALFTKTTNKSVKVFFKNTV